MKVLAVDPGGTTGWAWYHTGPLNAHEKNADKLYRGSPIPVKTPIYGQVPDGFDGACDAFTFGDGYDPLSLHEPTRMLSPDVLVIERYSIQERTVRFSRQMDAPEIIGYLKGCARLLGIEVVMQQPAEAKRLFTDARLKEFGWWATGEEHARDALRHLGFFLASKRLISLVQGVAL